MDNIQIVQEVYHHFGKSDISAMLAHFDEDVIWVRPGEPEIPFSGTFKGHEGLGKFFHLVAQNVRIKEFLLKNFLSNEDTVAVIGEDSADVIPTGKSYTTYWTQVFTFKDGKIIYGRAYIDTLEIAKAFRP